MQCLSSRGPFRCPSEEEVREQLLDLLPRGRAWQTHDGGPRPGSRLWGYWAAFAALLWFLAKRLCDLRLEFWCATHTAETHDIWLQEYGLPDDCDPFPDLCVKVAAIGGQRCEYFREITRRAGWVITCVDGIDECGGQAGCATAGCSTPGFSVSLFLTIIVHLGDSPSYSGGAQTPPLAGRLKAGQGARCAPTIGPLRCLMDRIAPAHVQVRYLTTA